MNIAMSFAVLALICTCGAIVVVTVKTANNFDVVSNAYGITISEDPDIMRVPVADLWPGAAGITISEDHAIMRVLRPGATAGSTSITFTDGDGKPQKGVLVRKGNKVTVYSNAANRLTPLKRAAR